MPAGQAVSVNFLCEALSTLMLAWSVATFSTVELVMRFAAASATALPVLPASSNASIAPP